MDMAEGTFMKPIHIQLSHEGGNIGVLEILTAQYRSVISYSRTSNAILEAWDKEHVRENF